MVYIFFSLSFCKSFICFQLFPSILIYQIIYSSIWFLFFWFFELFIKLIFFSILHFNKKFVFIFYFNFYPRYLDSFFGSSYSIDFFFQIHPSIKNKICFILQFWSFFIIVIYFLFWILLCNWYSFSKLII